MVQPTASVEDRLNAALAASQAEAAVESAAARAPAPAESRARARTISAPARTNIGTEPARLAPAQTAERRASQPIAAPDPAPVAEPNTAVREEAPAAAAPAQADEARVADSGTDQSLLWAFGGGALLLAGLGGAAAVRRRRTRVEAQEYAEALPVAAPSTAEPRVAAPTTAMERAPVSGPGVNRPAMAATAGAADGSSLAAMVAAPPSAENPFRTHRKRMARARFLLAQQEKREQVSHGSAPTTVPPQTIHAEPQMQTVYRLGADRNRRMSFKPQTR